MNILVKSALIVSLAIFLTTGIASADPDTSPPIKPYSLTATRNVTSQIYLTWGASTDNVGVAGYYVYRNGSLVGNTSNFSYLDTVPSGIYFYTVTAYDAAGNISLQSDQASITYLQDTTPPTIPSSLSAAVASSSVTLSWKASTDNIGVVGYYIYRNNQKITTTSTIETTNYTDAGFTTGDLNTYSVAAYDGVGNISDKSSSITVMFDATPPSTPYYFTSKVISQSEIDLSWQQSTDNVAVSGYYIYRDGAQIGTVSSTLSPAYANIGLTPLTQYTYTVKSYDSIGNVSPPSLPSFAKTLAPDINPPSSPSKPKVTITSSSSVALSWTAAIDDIGIARYDIYRDAIRIASTTSLSYTDSGLGTSTSTSLSATHIYSLFAYDWGGNASPSSSAAINLSPTPTSTTKTIMTVYSPTSTSQVVSAPKISSSTTAPSTPNYVLPETTTTVSTELKTTTLLLPESFSPIPSIAKQIFKTTLRIGMNNTSVKNMQLILAQYRYLDTDFATGFFGEITKKALQKMQCDWDIVCFGGTNWGTVGLETRTYLNLLLNEQ